MSQLNEYRRCTRRWFLRKVRRVKIYDAEGKITQAHKKGANTGQEIHGDLDRYYKTGTVVAGSKHERKVRAALAHLPPCGPQVSSEERFHLPIVTESGKALAFTGVMDLVDKRHLPEILFLPDHKTTGRISEIEENPVDVANDAQMLTYAHVGYETYNPRMVKVAHNTISTKHVARTIPPVYVDIPRQKAQQNWVDQIATIGTMIQLAELPPSDWTDVQYNAEACSDYGGCDFLPLCSVRTPTLGVPVMAHSEEAASELLAKLKALNVPPETPVIPIVSPTLEAPAELVETSEIALLPPDAPSRLTALETTETPKTVKKAGRPKKAKEEAPVFTAPVSRWEYDIDKMAVTVDELKAALEVRGEDGWECIGFFDGIYAVLKRPRL